MTAQPHVLVIDWLGHPPTPNKKMAAARDARYAALSAACKEHRVDALLVAHTAGAGRSCCSRLAAATVRMLGVTFTVVSLVTYGADDQAETVLMRLSRASGIDGLAGISACSNLREAAPARSTAAPDSPNTVASSISQPPEHVHQQGSTRVMRPLLWASKAELQSLLREAGVSWLEDPTNADTNFTRNFIRHLPGMQPVCAELPAWPTQQLAVEPSAYERIKELRSVPGPDSASSSNRQMSSPKQTGNIHTDLLRIGTVCADASHLWTSAAANLLTACVRPLSTADERPTAVGCSMDMAQLSQAPFPVMNRALSATMQVIQK